MMAGLQHISGKKLKLFLLALILITFGVIFSIFIGYRQLLNRPDVKISSFKKDADLSIDRVQQTATKDGLKEWSLDADSAHYNDKKKQAFFKDLSVAFFLKNGQRVNVTADEGTLKTDSSNIEAFGNVVVKNEKYRLNTENIRYDHQRRLISSKTPVKIWSEEFHLEADSLTFDLNTNRATLLGNVRGIFNENFQL
jgi:LPS export ABC transporter protein LptC